MSNRMKKVNALLLREISILVEKETRGAFVTVTEVATAPDLKSADVWISVLYDEYDDILSRLQDLALTFQRILAKKLDLRYIPRLNFKKDRSGKLASRIDQILEQEKINKDNP